MLEDFSLETTEQLELAAAEWVVRVDRGPLDPVAAYDFEQWLAANVRHRGAYARMQAALAYLDENLGGESADAKQMTFAPSRHSIAPARGISRRGALWLGGGAAAAAAALGAIFLRTESAPVATYMAQRGEILPVTLTDGTVVTLDTMSTISVKFFSHSREIELIKGRARFDVAKDTVRPFIVRASGLEVRAVGTSFVVRNIDSSPTQVLVSEGIVDVDARMNAIDGGRHINAIPVRVGANMRVTASLGLSLNVVSVNPDELSHESAWQRGAFEIEKQSLAAVAEEFARYSDTHVIIVDPSIAVLPITGRFTANKPLDFAEAVASTFGLKLEVAGSEIRLSKP